MIASLRGKLIRLDLNQVILETPGGVGYEIHIPFPLHLEIKKKKTGEEIFLFIYHSITDRSERLFGFSSNRDKELFQVMKSLNGIGELTALKILSFYNANALHKITIDENKSALEKIPKVKGKTSEKILFELKQNIKKLESFLTDPEDSERDLSQNSTSPSLDHEIQSLPEEENREKNLAKLGLLQLGFDEKTANKEVDRLWKEGIQEASSIIGTILKNL